MALRHARSGISSWPWTVPTTVRTPTTKHRRARLTTGAARWAGTGRARHPPTLSGHDLMRMFPAESPASARTRWDRRVWPASSSGYFADEERRYFARRERPRPRPSVYTERIVRARAGGGPFDGMPLPPPPSGLTRLRAHSVSDGVTGAAGDGIDGDDEEEDDVVGGFRIGMPEGEGTPPNAATRPNRARNRKSAATIHHAALDLRRPSRVGNCVPDAGPGRPGARCPKETVSAMLPRSVPARALGMSSNLHQRRSASQQGIASPIPSSHIPSYMIAAGIPVLRVNTC